MELTTKITGDKMKIKTVFNAAREGTAQMIWDRVAVVVDENDEEMMNRNKAIVTSHKNCSSGWYSNSDGTKTFRNTKTTFCWEVIIESVDPSLSFGKSFRSRKEAQEFIKENLLN